jgi:hypothetical protein
MATQTTHYNLSKPDPNTDNADISVLNTDMDAIDTQMYNNAQAASAAQMSANNAQTTANEATAPGAANDTVIGNRTADPTQVPNGLTGTLTQFLSWITNRIKAITGTANWYDAPPTTLTAAEAHMTNTSNPHNVTAAQTGAIPTTAEGSANGVATTDANNKVVQIANNSDKLGGQPAASYPLLGQANTFTGNQTAPAFSASGLNSNLTIPLRIIGAATGGSPTSGTYQKGDVMIDFSLRQIWLCTVSGSPGTWQSINPASAVSALSGGTKIQSGIASFSSVTSGTVTFPSAFSSAPTVIAMSDERLAAVYLPSPPTTTSFTFDCGYGVSNLYWIALGN